MNERNGLGSIVILADTYRHSARRLMLFLSANRSFLYRAFYCFP